MKIVSLLPFGFTFIIEILNCFRLGVTCKGSSGYRSQLLAELAARIPLDVCELGTSICSLKD